MMGLTEAINSNRSSPTNVVNKNPVNPTNINPPFNPQTAKTSVKILSTNVVQITIISPRLILAENSFKEGQTDLMKSSYHSVNS